MWKITVAVAAITAVGSGLVNAAPNYSFTDLGTFGGSYSVANDINDSGKVVGFAYKPFSGNSAIYSAFIWNGSALTDLGTLGGTQSLATAINNSDQVAGWANITGDSTNHAVIWNGTTVTDLHPAGSGSSGAYGINDYGQVAGYENSGFSNRATIWNDGIASPLGNSPGSLGESINNSGQVVGSETNGYQQAVLWNGGEKTILSNNSMAMSINNAGQIVGMSMEITTGEILGNPATLWTGTEAIYLGYLGGTQSLGMDINDRGQVVGYSFLAGNSTPHAFLWDEGVMLDLNDFLDTPTKEQGWVLKIARAINNGGWIVGDASNNLTGETHAFLLSISPVPEAETYSMLLAGLGLVGIAWRRREHGRKIKFPERYNRTPNLRNNEAV